jgi:hypothetical protein
MSLKPPTHKQYRKAEIRLVFLRCPTIKPCKDCGWPVVSGEVCIYCNFNVEDQDE